MNFADDRQHADQYVGEAHKPEANRPHSTWAPGVHFSMLCCESCTSARITSSVVKGIFILAVRETQLDCAAIQERTASKSKIVDQAESIDLKPPKGTRDFYPDDMRLRTWMLGEFTAVSELFGFEQYDSPVLENEALFVRKAGEEIRDQLFNFNDKGDRPVALRPELTPSLSRMFLAKAGTLPQPVKWYGIGQCWRYERMTRGRRREHYQWNMDIIGVAEVTAEAELLSAITTFFKVSCIMKRGFRATTPLLCEPIKIRFWSGMQKALGMAMTLYCCMQRLGLGSEDVRIRVNNRKVLQAVAQQNSIPDEQFSAVCVVLDKLEKIPEEEVWPSDATWPHALTATILHCGAPTNL